MATHRRPAGLRRLLEALAGQVFPGAAPRVRVVVVDNDGAGSARAVCEDAREALGLDLVYAVEPTRGIAPARNAGLRAALPGADFVAFVDDDGAPSRAWLAELLRVQAECAADVVTGPAEPVFDEPPPAWIVEGRFFEGRPHATGDRLATAYTHNALVQSRVLRGRAPVFDERLGLTGGEDSELFERLAREGRTIVWAAEAVVRESVPLSRARLGWILRRALRVGAVSAGLERRRGHLPRALRLWLHAAWCLARAALDLTAALFRGRAAAAEALRLGAYGVGRALGSVGLRVDEYRRVPGTSRAPVASS